MCSKKNENNLSSMEMEHNKNSLDYITQNKLIEEMCDWCGVRPVTYMDASYSLCEICEEQLWGD